MFKRKNYFAPGAVVIVAAVLLSLSTRATSHLKLAVGSWFLPLFGLAGAAQQLPADLADSVLPRRELLRQIDSLRRENQELKAQQSQAAAVARENDQFRALFNWQKQSPWQLKPANVVMRDPANWWRTVQIDLGSRDGLRENLPVMTSDGLIGRVASVGLTRAQVILIGDPNCRVSARVEDPANDIGVLGAGGPLDGSLVQMTYLSSSANLKPGLKVVTSGQGGVFPKGIRIGQIVDSQTVEFGLYTSARVKLWANLGALEQVWVVMNPEFL
jgi:rod shape-determining protein MreC